ncbi:hypothetical protein ACWGST_10430 [Agromyces sp. NPDC055520]
MIILVLGFGVLVILGGSSIIGALRRIADATEQIARNSRVQVEAVEGQSPNS